MLFNKKLLKVVLLQLSLMMVVLGSILLLFFQFALPILTKHGASITVPNLKGMPLEEAKVCLRERALCFACTEEVAYSPDYLPLVVLQQYPRAGARVKENRKIYLTLNSAHPPKVRMPHLVDGSLRNAQLRLKSYGLLYGEIKYVPDIVQNAVLAQWYNGKQIEAGTWIPKGSKIDLLVGAGLDKQCTTVPAVIGSNLEEAALALLEAGVKIGTIIYEAVPNEPLGTIFCQVPAAGSSVRLGETVDVWLVGFQEDDPSADLPILPANNP